MVRNCGGPKERYRACHTYFWTLVLSCSFKEKQEMLMSIEHLIDYECAVEL